MLKLLIFGHWPRWIIALFDRNTLNVPKIGLFVNCMSAKPVQTHFLVQSWFLLQLLLLLLLLLGQRVLPQPVGKNWTTPWAEGFFPNNSPPLYSGPYMGNNLPCSGGLGCQERPLVPRLALGSALLSGFSECS